MKIFKMYQTRYLRAFGVLGVLLWCAGELSANEVCLDGECGPALSEVKYFDWDAYRLSDGKTEAVVVPAIGRVMSFRRVGGKEWLWSAKARGAKVADWGGWKNWGGERTWLAPQSRWSTLGGKDNWPPAPEWGDRPYEAEVLSGGALRITSAVNAASGVRIIREFKHEDDGTFSVRQTAEKVRGAPVEFGVWNIAQVDAAQIGAVFVPRATQSDYPNGFLWMSPNRDAIKPVGVTSNLISVAPTLNGAYKIGTDATVCAIAALREDEVLVLSASRPAGVYPDGEKGKSGTPVQLYGQGDPKMNFLELELLGPLNKAFAGSRWTHTIKWRVEKLPSADTTSPEVRAAIEKLLGL